MMYHRARLFWLLLIIFAVLVVSPAWATMITYTDRAAFDAAAGATHVLDLSSPRIVLDPYAYIATWTYEDLMTFHFDFPIYPPSGLTLGYTGLMGVAEVLVPVTAFGFDFIAEEIGDLACADSPAACRPERQGFIGYQSDTPFHAQVEYGLFGPQSFTLSQIAIQAVPEPSTLLLLGAGLVGVAAWRGLRRRSQCV